MMAFRLARRELALICRGPAFWVLLALIQAFAAWWFLLLLEQYRSHYQPLVVRVNSPMGVNDLVVLPFFGSVLLLGALLLGAAMLAMRLLADERRSGGLQLLLSSPISMTQLALGKYLAALVCLALLALPWMLLPWTLAFGAELDTARLLSACLGVLMLVAVLAAIALFASSITAQPATAAALTVAIGIAFMGLNAGVEVVAGGDDALADYLAMLSHYEPLVQGLIRSSDLIYFLLLAVAFVGFTIRQLDSLRTQR